MPSTIEQALTLARCDRFVDFQIWPSGSRIDSEGWLSNFLPEEKTHALALLRTFLYYPSAFTAILLRHAIQQLSDGIVGNSTCHNGAKHAWRHFLETATFCRVTGETPNDTDSGFTMLRMARQNAGILEAQISTPEQLLANLSSTSSKTVIFLDDFVESGNQFIETWQRLYPTARGTTSFHIIDNLQKGHRFFYLPIISTSLGARRIHQAAPNVRFRPTHTLGSEYNLLSPDCPFWPANLKPTARTFIQNASDRAGIPSTEWQGFHNLGLAFAFEHSTPDATLPLLHWNTNGWRPLIKRT